MNIKGLFCETRSTGSKSVSPTAQMDRSFAIATGDAIYHREPTTSFDLCPVYDCASWIVIRLLRHTSATAPRRRIGKSR